MTAAPGSLPRRRYLGVVEDVLHAIALGELSPDDRLPDERALAARCGVSRATVREALVALELGGIVEVRPGAGCFVTTPEVHPRPSTVPAIDAAPRQILDVRRLLEPGAARWCASNPSGRQIDRLTSLLHEAASQLDASTSAAHSPDGTDRFTECNHEFHREIARFSGNAVLADMIRQLTDTAMHPLWTLVDTIAGRSEDVRADQHAEHRAVLEAIRAADPDAAAEAMSVHLDAMTRRIFGPAGGSPVRRAGPRTSRRL